MKFMMKIQLSKESVTEIMQERYKYHWQLVNVDIKKHFDSVSFCFSIPGIPKTKEFEQLQGYFEEAFYKLLPGLEKLKLINREKKADCRLSVKHKNIESTQKFHMTVSGMLRVLLKGFWRLVFIMFLLMKNWKVVIWFTDKKCILKNIIAVIISVKT
jgi:hypothetical protein